MSTWEVIFTVLTIIAIVIGPILAVWRGNNVEDRKEKRWTREQLFFSLTCTRDFHLWTTEQLRKLNTIDFIFYGEKKVISAWYALMNELNKPSVDMATKEWGDKVNDLYYSLLSEMAKILDYNFEKIDIQMYAFSAQKLYDENIAHWFQTKKTVEAALKEAAINQTKKQ